MIIEFEVSQKSITIKFIGNPEQQMKNILEESWKHGVMSEQDKSTFIKLIKRNGTMPKELRKDLWLLASGAEQAKRSNIKYCMDSYYKHSMSRFRIKNVLEFDNFCEKEDPLK